MTSPDGIPYKEYLWHKISALETEVGKLRSQNARLQAENEWLEKTLRDAVNTCYGGVTHTQIDARSFKVT